MEFNHKQEKNMHSKIFSIHDQKAEYFNTPFFNKTHGEAERNFRTAVQDPKTTLNKHPEDFDLYYMGTYDDQSGEIKSLKTPEFVIKGIHCLPINLSDATGQTIEDIRSGLKNDPKS